MFDWRQTLLERVGHGPVVVVAVTATEGSTPREVGACMLVHARGTDGSIGGGQLEFQETHAAQALLAETPRPRQREVHRIVLGPDAGQCCGGVVEITHDVVDTAEAAAEVIARATPPLPPAPLSLYGAGHVARALVHVLADLPFALRWIDIAAERFPEVRPARADIIVAPSPASVAASAAPNTMHLVITHSHDLDAEICEALLRRGNFVFLGLIGSATKRARFAQRFSRAGIDAAMLQRLTCPIGLPAVQGKAPAIIAVGVAAQLLALRAP